MATNVTTTVPINMYAYHPKNLYLAYGFALVFALLANALGAFAYVSNGVSYDSLFSTILRTTRNPDLTLLIGGSGAGALPLGRKMSDALLRLGIYRVHGPLNRAGSNQPASEWSEGFVLGIGKHRRYSATSAGVSPRIRWRLASWW